MLWSIRPLDRVFNHPFNKQLGNGTLSLSQFCEFLGQDKLYYVDFVKALQQIANRLPDSTQRTHFQQLADKAAQAEWTLYEKYLYPLTLHTDQPKPPIPTQKIPAIAEYTVFLLATTQNAPIEVALASILPCFYLYSRLGLRMQPLVTPDNPYQPWIATYSDPSFVQSTQTIIKLTNELGSMEPRLLHAMIRAFKRSTAFEIAFWDAVTYIPKPEDLALFTGVEGGGVDIARQRSASLNHGAAPSFS